MRSDHAPTNDPLDRHDTVTIALHWITVGLVAAMFLLALVPGVVKGSIALHKNIGLLLLVVVPLRLVWRLTLGRRLAGPADVPKLLRLGAKGAHVALYALLLGTAALGWLYVDAKGMELHLFGVDVPSVAYYDRELAMAVYGWKKLTAYTLLALIFAHAAAAIVYHHWLRGDGVLAAMLPARRRRVAPVAASAALAALLAAPGPAEAAFDVDAYAKAIAASLAKACPMAKPDDVAAHEACRKAMGQGVEAGMRDYSFLFGGQQQGLWLKEKKTTVFRGDLFQDLYMSLFMFTGEVRVETAPDGNKTVALQAYFRNGLPAGLYPYPFWHSDPKWDAYEKANQIRLRLSPTGKVLFAYRADVGSEANRGPYQAVKRPPFLGEWMWPGSDGIAEPRSTLFSAYYSPDNPQLAALDEAYRRMAISFRNADCTVCHAPDGHRKMNKLTLLQTPLHAAAAIDAVIDEVRLNKMPVDDYEDPRPLPPRLRQELLANGEAFRDLLRKADAWEAANGRPKARRVAAK
ncbi:cytochrome b [Stella sp.]|uniref:cytochrome b n=1 Tax=Stella sp. TaxID=2912054 RepID=UPI0035B41C9A